MIHDPQLLDQLSAFSPVTFDGEIYRATRKSLDPLAPSNKGGRWAPEGVFSVLYTSLSRDGALAEVAFHWSQLTPLPTGPVALHRISLTASKTVRLSLDDLAALGVNVNTYKQLNQSRTREIGAAACFLGWDGLVVPSARWDTENFILISDNHALSNRIELRNTEEVNWLDWARAHGFLEGDSETTRK